MLLLVIQDQIRIIKIEHIIKFQIQRWRRVCI